MLLAALVAAGAPVTAQVPPTPQEEARYEGLFAAAARGDAGAIARLAAGGAAVDARDGHGRTPLHVAAFARRHDAMRALVRAGADPNALESDRYDIVTIAAVAGDVPTLAVALELGCSAQERHQPLRRHRADRRRAPGPRRGGAHADPRRRAARPRQQPGLDRADRVDRAGRRRRAPHGDAAGAGRRRRERQPRRPRRRARRCSSPGRAATGRWRRSSKGPAHAESRVSAARRESPRAAGAVRASRERRRGRADWPGRQVCSSTTSPSATRCSGPDVLAVEARAARRPARSAASARGPGARGARRRARSARCRRVNGRSLLGRLARQLGVDAHDAEVARTATARSRRAPARSPPTPASSG